LDTIIGLWSPASRSSLNHGTLQIACQLAGKSEWTQEDNLTLMTRKRLWRIAAPAAKSAAVGCTGLLLGPLSSNLYLALH
jgi:hypothetical protein